MQRTWNALIIGGGAAIIGAALTVGHLRRASHTPVAAGRDSVSGATANSSRSAADVGDVEQDPTAFWENHYGQTEQIWSGEPNRTLVDLVEDFAPGTAADLGSGEGGDVVWLARRGWKVTGVDISTTAIQRAEAAARAAGLTADQAGFVAADLTQWRPEEKFDLVTASFLQSPVRLDRVAILRHAAAAVAPGGRLLVISHASTPFWAGQEHHHDFPTPEEELAQMDLDPASWRTAICGVTTRIALAPDGREGELEDAVILLERQ